MDALEGARQALKKIVHGVYVIGARDKGRINAMTAAWVARASFDPLLVVAAIGPSRHTHAMISSSKAFSISVLGKSHVEAGRNFGLRSGRDIDKFANVEYETAGTGSPILKNCVAWLDCELYSSCEAGDHTLFIGKVTDGGVKSDEPPLAYERETFLR